MARTAFISGGAAGVDGETAASTVGPSSDPTPRHLAARRPVSLWAQALGLVACLAVALGLIAGSALMFARDGRCEPGGGLRGNGTCVDSGGGL